MVAWLTPTPPAPAQPNALPAPLRAALQEAGVPASAVAVYIHPIGARRPALAWNADQPMNPASAMKVVTTLAALELLGPAYTWRTEAYADGALAEGVLDGNLVLKGYGDPKLTLEDFWHLLRDLRARGIRHIRGDLVLDRSFFAPAQVDAAAFDNEPTRPYNVLPDALLINFKSIQLRFVPEEESRTVRILAEPQLPQVAIVNQLALAHGNCELWPEKPQASPGQAQLVFTGVFPAGCGEKTKSFSLLAPNEYALAVFQQLWNELGGTHQGGVRDGVRSDTARLIASRESRTLAELIRDMNKFSNNVMARQLFLTLSLSVDAPPASSEKAARAVRDWLGARGLDFPELVIENGSGLSRNERISAAHLGQLLLRAWETPLMPEFISSLPLLGTDGTLRRRLPGSPVAGRAHMKTGYLDGVRALAGYVQDRDGRNLVVVSVVNHANALQAQPFQEAVVEWAHTGQGGGCCKRD
jgi:D-alanyl-D-alanine carboxypeptidase/D-alanyl-D-alanine-endopeptidase (penicillin-binding protein 4)